MHSRAIARPHIRNISYQVGSAGEFNAADNRSPSTPPRLRGLLLPSIHSRALA
ncbi:hypothetical protein ACFOPN_01575 [Xanthomonas hyacinthi]|uniref:hypothetical protein n=1 Tax=Xanthomonas hyacinthi TaxID=56455 RepID=UPI000A91083A